MSSHKKTKKIKASNKKPPISIVANDSFRNGAERCFTVSFNCFNDKEDEMAVMSANELNRFIKVLKYFCQCRNIQEFEQKISNRISPVYNKNDYSRFFRTVPADAELREVCMGDKRCFFWVNIPEKVIQIIAFCHHPEHKKQKK